MSRETVDDLGGRRAPVALDVTPVGLDVADGPGPEDGVAPEDRGRRPAAQVVWACAVTAAVVGLVAGLAVLVVVRPGGREAAEAPVLLGGYLSAGFTEARAGVVPMNGRVQVVNAGSQAVEVLRADVYGVRGQALEVPVAVPPGAVEHVGVSFDLPCGSLTTDGVSLEVQVVDAQGDRGRSTLVDARRLADDQMGPADAYVQMACTTQSSSDAEVTRMAISPDGAVELEATSRSDRPVVLEVTASPRSGLTVTSTRVDLQRGTRTPLRVDVTVVDCDAAREDLAVGFESLTVSTTTAGATGSDPGAAQAWVDGWNPGLASAAVGFAIARQC